MCEIAYKGKTMTTRSGYGVRGAALLALLAVLAGSRGAAADDCAWPNMLVVLDKSSSMLGTLASGQTKWDAVKTALEAALETHDAAIHFGLMEFPFPDQCGPGELRVDVGPNAAEAFAPFLAVPPPAAGNHTPLKQTLDAVAAYAPLLDPTRDNYVLLITDGEQWCSAADDRVYDREVSPKVTVLRSLGITTYVVGLAQSVNPCMLGDAAVRGGTALPGCDWNHQTDGCQLDPARECYYHADEPTALTDALAEIARQVSEEVCDGVDNDCDGQVDARACASECGEGVESCAAGVWSGCDAPIPQPEDCDGVDDDCDGQTDESLTRSCDTACGEGSETCQGGEWVGCTAPQPATEACDDALDNDCDGQTDEDCGDCVNGTERACGSEVGECAVGTQTCTGGAWGACGGALVDPAGETCNDRDDDCDADTDEGLSRSCANACGEGTERCAAGQWGGCDAPQPVPEVCNDIDDDCDGRTDEDLVRSCTGTCGAGQQTCAAGDWQACDAPEPVAEFCNGGDDDCDGATDEDADLCPVGLVCLDGVCTLDPGPPGGEDTNGGGGPDAGNGGAPDAGPGADTGGVSGQYEGQGRMVSGVGGAVGCQAGGPAPPAAGLLLLLPLLALAAARVTRRRA